MTRILIVEDVPEAAEKMKLLAESCGYEVWLVNNYDEALCECSTELPAVMLLDETIWYQNKHQPEEYFIHMANINGIPVIRIADAGSMGKKLPDGISGVIEKCGWKPTSQQKKRFKAVVEKVLGEKK